MSDLVPLCKFNRISKPPDYLNDYEVSMNNSFFKYSIEDLCFLNSSFSPECACFMSVLNKVKEPDSIIEGLNDHNWKLAMDNKINVLMSRETWELVDLPINRETIGCKWVFKGKYNVDGSIERHKVRLVAKGFNQCKGVDYHETFSPVVKLVFARCVIHLAIPNNWNLF